jgi:hypothetical protein
LQKSQYFANQVATFQEVISRQLHQRTLLKAARLFLLQ